MTGSFSAGERGKWLLSFSLETEKILTTSNFRTFQRSLSSNGTLDEMTQLIPPLLEKLEDRLRLSGLEEDDCLTQTICEAIRPQLEFSFNTLGDAIRDIHG